MANALTAAFIAIVNRLRDISVADGYHTDAGLRVMLRHANTLMSDAPPTPYLCVVLQDDAPINVESGGSLIDYQLDVDVIGYYTPSASNVLEQSDAISALQLQSDILRCLFPSTRPESWSAESAVIKDLTFVGKTSSSETIVTESTETIPPRVTVTVRVQLMLERGEVAP